MIIFHTQHLNKRLYRNMIWNVLMHFYLLPNDFLKKWEVHLWDLKETNSQFFEHVKLQEGQSINTNMPSGVTGQYRVDLYLHDSNNEFKDRENSDRLQHELCHAVLFGTPHFVKGVHNNTKRFKIYFWYWTGSWWKKFQLSIIDIREFL